MNRKNETFADPVELPEGVEHCSASAYNRFGCRCRYCVIYRRLYDSAARYREKARKMPYQPSAKAYLESRGVLVFGGPFKSRQLILARIVADYFNDDLKEWFK